MRIGFDAKRAFLNKSGLGNYSRNTINALSNYYPQIEQLLFTTGYGNNLFSCENHTIKTPLSYYPKFLKAYWRSNLPKNLIRKSGIEIYHGLSNELPRSLKRLNVKSVVTIHDLIFLKHPEFYSLIDREIYLNKIHFACENADKIIAISEYTKNDILRHFKVKPDKITVIHQSISDVFFQKIEDGSVLDKFPLQKNYILSVGTLEDRKNQLSLLKAIVKTGVKNQIVFVGGKTNYFKFLNSYIQENSLQQQVLFLSNIDEKDLKALYNHALFSAYISTYEGFGLPIIESMACGCPAITSNVSCMPDTAGEAALFCNPYDVDDIADKVQQLINSAEMRKNLTQKGLERAEKFKSQHYAGNLYRIYQEILEK